MRSSKSHITLTCSCHFDVGELALELGHHRSRHPELETALPPLDAAGDGGRDHPETEDLVELVGGNLAAPAVMVLVDLLEDSVAHDAVELQRHLFGIGDALAELLSLCDLGFSKEVLDGLTVRPRRAHTLSIGRLRCARERGEENRGDEGKPHRHPLIHRFAPVFKYRL
jgi:hypothetical protein